MICTYNNVVQLLEKEDYGDEAAATITKYYDIFLEFAESMSEAEACVKAIIAKHEKDIDEGIV